MNVGSMLPAKGFTRLSAAHECWQHASGEGFHEAFNLQPMNVGSMLPAKGFTRLSAILFGCCLLDEQEQEQE